MLFGLRPHGEESLTFFWNAYPQALHRSKRFYGEW